MFVDLLCKGHERIASSKKLFLQLSLPGQIFDVDKLVREFLKHALSALRDVAASGEDEHDRTQFGWHDTRIWLA